MVHLVYRDAVTGRITRYETYTPPEPYGLRDYARDIVVGLVVGTLCAAIVVAAWATVILIGAY